MNRTSESFTLAPEKPLPGLRRPFHVWVLIVLVAAWVVFCALLGTYTWVFLR